MSKDKEMEVTASDTTSIDTSAPSVSVPKKTDNERVRVTIASDPNDPCGMMDVTIGCNGKVIRVKRDVPVMIQRKYLNVLNDAVKKTYIVGDNGEITGERRVPRYNVILG